MFSTQQYSGFDPRTIPGCALWLDAADGNSFTPANPTGGTAISQWNDKSGNNRHATQSVVGNRPVYSVSDISVDTTTNPRFFDMTNMPSAPYDVFVVARPIANNSNWRSLFANGDPGTVPVVLEAGTNRLGYFTGATFLFSQFGSYTWSPSIRNLLFARMNSGKTMNASLNGDISLTANTAAGTASEVILFMGAQKVGSTVSQQWGNINEVIFYTTPLTTSQRQQVEGYLAWKWGLNTNLPTGHQFRPNPTAMRVFQPIDISGCNLWLDAMDKSTFTPANPSDGTGITAWSDKSGSNFTFSRTYGSTNATYNAASNSLFFSTSNAGYSSSHSASVNNETLFTVFTTTFNGSGYIVGATGPGGREVGLYLNWTRLGNINAGVEWAAITPNGSMTGGVRNLGVSTVSASSNLAVAVNGGTFTTYTLANPLGSNSQTSTLAVEGTTPTYSGHIHEVITYNRVLSTSERQQVEGYLATKWGTSSLLPSTQPYYLSRVLPSTPLFTPTSITGCSLWMDAADISTFTFSSGSNISQWRDKSSNALTGTAGFSGNAPTRIENAQNNLPAVAFASSSFNRIDFGGVLNPGTSPVYIFAVSKHNSSTGAIIGKGGTGGSSAYSYTLFSASGNLIMRVEAFLGSASAFVANANTNTRLLGGSWDRSTIRLSQNGTTVATQNLVDSTNLSSSVNLSLGVSPDAFDYFLNGQIMEVIMYLGSMPTDRQQVVEGYLAWKWGLQNSLPTTHPYYKFRP